MRLKQHIIEGRSKFMYSDDAEEAIKKNCQQAVQAALKNRKIFRGIENSPGQFASVDPKKGTRTSRNTNNSYTLIIDNSPKWKRFPKRSKSIICTTDPVNANGYGKGYQVFPVDGSNYGICPSRDMWWSFQKGGVPDLHNFNYYVFHVLPEHFNLTVKKDFTSMFELKKILKQLDEKLVGVDLKSLPHVFTQKWIYDYNGDMFDLFMDLFVPSGNGFKQTKNPMDIPTVGGIGEGYEVWTDGFSYLVDHIWAREYLEDLVA